jgi:hypothetical protein
LARLRLRDVDVVDDDEIGLGLLEQGGAHGRKVI